MTVPNPILTPVAFQFRTGFYGLPVPPWLCTGNGEAYMYSLEYARDLLCERAYEAMTIRLPGVGDPSNIPWLAFDRNLVQGPAESNAAFSKRLTGAFAAWGEAGAAGAVLEQLQAYMSNLQPGVPATAPLLTIVQAPTNTSPTYTTWNQLYQGDPQGAPATLTRVTPANFAWDASTNETWRAWLVIPLAFVLVPGLVGGGASTSTAADSGCFTDPGQLVSGVWVPATSGTPINAPWLAIAGLSGLSGAQAGQWLLLEGSANPGNNGTFPIVSVGSSSSCVIANPAGVPSDAGPLIWGVVQYPWIGPGPAWGAAGVVFGQGEASPPPVELGSIIGGAWQPAVQQPPAGTAPLISWGLTCSSLVVQSIRQIVQRWKSAGTYYPNIVFAFDCNDGTAGSAYSPNSGQGVGNPDGTFGSVGALVAGVWSPTRLIPSSGPFPNTYDCYAQGTGIASNCSVENIT